MKIAIRKEPNGSIYIDKELRPAIDYTKPPYNFKIVEIDDKFADCEGTDFNDDFTINPASYQARHQRVYATKRIAQLKAELAKLDYIGIKIATGRATKEQYAEKIATMTALANEIDFLEKTMQ